MRFDGSRVRRELSKSAPVFVRRGPNRGLNRELVLLLMRSGGVYVCLCFGKVRFLEFGRSLKVGHVSSVGMPTNSNI